jgi:ADP-ribosylglycohydrolase
MIGAITDDIIGSIYERNNIKTKDFPLFGQHCTFTDDTVCTIAVADWLMNEGDLSDVLSRYVLRYPNAGYGGMFREWAQRSNRVPYNSWGNGSAMRVSAVMYVASDEQEALELAERSSAVTHNHPNAIAGGVAEVMFGLPDEIKTKAQSYLTNDLIDVVDRFVDHVASQMDR